MKPFAIAFMLFASFFVQAQVNLLLSEETEKKLNENEIIKLNKASKLIESRAYLEAAVYLDTLYETYPDDNYLCFLAGMCMSYNPNKASKALLLIQNAFGIKEKLADYDYHLAYAYEQNEKYDEALKFYNLYLKNKLPPDIKADVKHRIDYCNTSKTLSAKVAIVKISNLGKPLNSLASEYGPCLPSDESFMVFTYLGEKSKGGKQNLSKAPDKKNEKQKIDAIFFEDVFMSKRDKNGEWLPPFGIEGINTLNHDAAVSISHDGSKLFIFRNIGQGKGDIYQSNLNGETWSKPEKIKGINSLDWEGSVTLSPDEKHVVFSSERPGGVGGRDLWIAELLADGSWGNVKNMGEKINSKFDEDSPFISADGKSMFFSSNNSNSTGGYDIFRCDMVGGEWTKPYNVGKPVNTPQDDRFYVVSADGKRGYYSSGKAGGFGQQDIYIVEPGMIGKPIALVQIVGTVLADSLPAEAQIHVRSRISKKEVFGSINSNAATGKFLINLPSGDDYDVVFNYKNFPEQVKEVNTTFVDTFSQVQVFADFYSPKVVQAVAVDAKETKPDYENETFDFDAWVSKFGNSSADSLEFRIQVGAYKFVENFNYTGLIGMPKVIRTTLDDGVTRFVMGSFKSFNEATPLLISVKRKVIKDAFIIAVYKGHRVYVDDLMKMGILNK